MEVLIQRAVGLITSGEPLPLDLYTELLQHGIDVSELERKYNR